LESTVSKINYLIRYLGFMTPPPNGLVFWLGFVVLKS